MNFLSSTPLVCAVQSLVKHNDFHTLTNAEALHVLQKLVTDVIVPVPGFVQDTPNRVAESYAGSMEAINEMVRRGYSPGGAATALGRCAGLGIRAAFAHNPSSSLPSWFKRCATVAPIPPNAPHLNNWMTAFVKAL